MTTESTYDKYWNAKGEYGRERVRRKKLRKEKRFAKRTTCPQCHSSNVGPIELRLNPYYKEMNDVEIWERMCGYCYDAACGDI